MRAIEELAATTTGTTNFSYLQPEQWLKELIEYSKPNLKMLEWTRQFDISGTQDKSLTLPVSTSNLTFTSTRTQGSARTMTELSNLFYVTITPTWRSAGAQISYETVHTLAVDIMQYAKDELATWYSTVIEQTIRDAILAATGASSRYGGDATNTTTLATGDIMTTDLFADMKGDIEAYNFKPDVAFIGPEQVTAFRKDSQFANASEYGSDKVIRTGEIGSYLGVSIVVTTIGAKSYTTSDGWGADGRACIMMDSKKAVALVWKEKPTLDWEYEKDQRDYKIYLDMSLGADSIQDKAIGIMYVSNA